MSLLLAATLFLSTLEDLQAVKLTAVKFDLGGAPPNLTGPLEQNFDLTEAERYKIDELKGPESFVYYRAFSPCTGPELSCQPNKEHHYYTQNDTWKHVHPKRTGHIFTGLADGRIVDISDCGVRTVVKMTRGSCNGEAACGRPLGLRLDNRGRLLVADSSKGIFRVNVDTGEKEILFSSDTPVNGKKCKFINDVIVAKDGTILFTDSSTRWSRKEFLYVILEGETTGRLLAHSDKSNKTIVVLDNLAFPNGLEFGPNEEYLLISETARARVRRLSLKPGKTWLHLSTFASNLPGLPDNIRASGRGTYWVAMSQARHQNMSTLLDEYAGQPQMREMVAMMSSIEQILDMTEKYGMVVELNGDGEIIRSLQDPTGNHVAAVSEAMEHDGFLYLGSFDRPYVTRVSLTKTFHVERFLQKIKSTCRATKINISKLRMVLRRLVAIAEFRRALLNVKRRRQEKLRATQDTRTPPSIPSTTSAFIDLNTTTADLAINDTTTSQFTTLNMTESVTMQPVAENTTVAVSTANTTFEITTAANLEPRWTDGGTTTSTSTQASVTTIRTTTPEAVVVNPNAEMTETESNTAPR